MVTRIARVPVPLLVICLVLSCTSLVPRVDVTKIEIQKLEIRLTRTFGGEADSVVPGYDYHLVVDIYGKDGKKIDNPEYKDIIVNSDKFNVLREASGIRVEAAADMISLLEGDVYTVGVGVRNNPYPPVQRSWTVDWNKFNKLDYSGQDGRNGRDGNDGQDGSLSGTSFMRDGGNGENGADGSHGFGGRNVTLILVYYDLTGKNVQGIDGNRLLLIYDPENNKIFLSKIQTVTVDASGGRGGEGGKGGDGGKAGGIGPSIGPRTHVTDGSISDKPGEAGKPGKGGDGGWGGNGGGIILMYYNDSILSYFKTDCSGGKGGERGESGQAAFGSITSTFPASDGLPGTAGTVVKNKLSLEEIKSRLKIHPKIDLNRIVLE